ncbi:nonsense-mediated mRNA decay factor SMG5-like [Sarcophilus harrisii]
MVVVEEKKEEEEKELVVEAEEEEVVIVKVVVVEEEEEEEEVLVIMEVVVICEDRGIRDFLGIAHLDFTAPVRKPTRTERAVTMEPNETTKLLLKLVESAEQLDALLTRETAHQEVFQPHNTALRSQLEQFAVELILLSPGDYGRAAEELLWTKVYYDLKSLRKIKGALVDRESPEGAYREHFKNGIHVYHRLFFSVQAQFDLKLDNYIYWPSSQPWSQAKRAGSPSVEEMDWARKFCHRCLLRIGDLYHYLKDFTDSGEKQAKRYYYRALSLLPDMGLPFMHLATLSGAKFYYVEATCFYQCCLYSKVPHAGAILGLEQIYLEIEEEYRRLPRGPQGKLGPEQKAREDVGRLLVSFVYLQSLLTPNGRRHPELESLCESVLDDLELCLSYLSIQEGQGWARGPGAEQKRGSLLPNQVVFQMVILCLLTLENLKKAKSEVSKTALSFSLMFFSLIVRLLGWNIQAALQRRLAPGREERLEPKTEKPWLEEAWPELPAPQRASVNAGELSGSEREPRFSVAPPGPEDSWEDSEPMDISEPDGTWDSYRVLDDSEDSGDVSFCSLPDSDSSFSEGLSREREVERPSEEDAIGSSWTLPNAQALQERLEILCAEGLLPALRVILQWLASQPALTALSMRELPGLWNDLLLVLNLMPRAEELANPHLGLAPGLRELLPHFERPSPPISMPLLEDMIVHTLLPFQAAHGSLNFELDVFPAFSREDVALRACVLRTFGHFAAQLPDSLILFDSKLGLFLQTGQKGQAPRGEAREEGAPPCIQEGAAQPGLPTQVQSLQTSLRLLRTQTALSPYLIVDTVALFQHLPLVREMAQSGRFVVIVPRIVIDELDGRKNEVRARYALRFLEDELKQKNRRFWCQVQVRGRSLRPRLGGGDAPAWNLYSILCGYEEVLRTVGEEVDTVRGMVTILTALHLVEGEPLSPPLTSAFEAAHKAGVAIDHIFPFYSHWKALSYNSELRVS